MSRTAESTGDLTLVCEWCGAQVGEAGWKYCAGGIPVSPVFERLSPIHVASPPEGPPARTVLPTDGLRSAMSTGREIRLTEEDDWWVARDVTAGLTAQGETRDDALDALDAVVDAVHGDGGHEPTDEELRELGVDPETARTQGELPDVLQE